MEDIMVTDTTTHTHTARVLAEGYGPGAWHGADLKAAIDGITPATAFWRPAPGRHNIAEIALHHAYCARNVRAQITGVAAAPFVMDGDDWFNLSDERALPWDRVRATVDAEQSQLALAVASGTTSRLSDEERFALVLGITSHAIYHAGQIQLIKRLQEP
jgi:hypothetical protein